MKAPISITVLLVVVIAAIYVSKLIGSTGPILFCSFEKDSAQRPLVALNSPSEASLSIGDPGGVSFSMHALIGVYRLC